MRYYDENRNPISLGALVGSGGEADVFDIGSNKVVKLYKKSIEQKKLRKIMKLIEIGKVATFSSNFRIVFPLGLIYANNAVVGYSMQKITSNAVPILHLTQPNKGMYMGYINYKHIMQIFLELAKAIKSLHTHGIYIIDFNDKNFLVDHSLTLYLLDVDNWAIKNIGDHEVYFAEYAPHEDYVAANMYTDIYSYLFLLYFFMFFSYPYIGKPREVTPSQATSMSLLWRKKNAQFFLAGSHNKQGKKILLSEPDTFKHFTENHISQELKSIYVNVFANEYDYKYYPSMDQIIQALSNYINNLKPCKKTNNHYHYSSHCPWCLRAKAGLKEFNEGESNLFEPVDEKILKKIQANMDDYLVVNKKSAFKTIIKIFK